MVPLSALPILVMSCLEVDAVVFIMAELVAVVTIYFAEVPPRRLHGNATPRDTSRRIGVGAGEVVGVDLRHHPPNVLKVAILPFKVRLADPVVLWWKELQDYVLVPAVRSALLRTRDCEPLLVPLRGAGRHQRSE